MKPQIVSPFQKLLRWLNLFLIIITLFTYLSPLVDPATIWIFAIIAPVYPWLLLGNVVFILFWLIRRNWYFLFSLSCILMGVNHFESFVGFNLSNKPIPTNLTLLSFNSQGFYKMTGNGKAKEKADFQGLLATQKPDILCVQEFVASNSPINKKDYPYSYIPNGKRLAIFSKFPISNKGNMAFGNRSNGCIYGDIKIGDQSIRVYNMHLQSNNISNEADKLSQEGDLIEKETWSDIKGIVGKVKHATQVRSRQAFIINQHVEKSNIPVIIAGDMNETPLSYVYKMFAQTLTDGFQQRGNGIGTTYAGAIPALRIDYIFADERLQFGEYRTFRESFSDHFPLISKVEIP